MSETTKPTSDYDDGFYAGINGWDQIENPSADWLSGYEDGVMIIDEEDEDKDVSED